VFSCGKSDIASVSEIVMNHVIPCTDSSSLYARIDRLLDSNDNDQYTAYNELISQENLVGFFLFSDNYYMAANIAYLEDCDNFEESVNSVIMY